MQPQLEPGEQVLVDARGHRCPTPTLRLRRALAAAPEGAVVVLLADDPLARIDVPHFAAAGGHALLDQWMEGPVFRFRVRRGGAMDGADRG
jgi:tRNA 2-thiouridine synthesizing protein A